MFHRWSHSWRYRSLWRLRCNRRLWSFMHSSWSQPWRRCRSLWRLKFNRWRHTWARCGWWICWFVWNGCRWRIYGVFKRAAAGDGIGSPSLLKRGSLPNLWPRKLSGSTGSWVGITKRPWPRALSNTWRRKGSPKGFSVSSCGSPSGGGSEKTIVSTSDTLSIETVSSWFSCRYSSSLGKTILLLSVSGHSHSRNCSLALTLFSLCSNGLRPTDPGSRNVRRRTMYSRLPSSSSLPEHHPDVSSCSSHELPKHPADA